MNLNVGTATRWGINAVILLAFILALYLGHSIFIPLVIALLLAAMLWPFATWLNQAGVPALWARPRSRFPWLVPSVARLRLSWGIACLAVVLGLIGLVIAIAVAFGIGMSKMVLDLGDYEKQGQVYNVFRDKLHRISPALVDGVYITEEPEKSRVLESIRSFFNFNSEPFRDLLGYVAGFGGNFIWQSVLVMFILLFLLLEGRMLSRRFVEIFGPGAAVQGKAVEALQDMAYQLRNYLVWRTIINFVMAAFLGVLYHLLGLKLAWIWALLTAVLWYVPYLGPIAAGVPPVLDAFITCPSPWVAVFILVFYAVFTLIEGYVIVPVVMGRSMEMNATTVLLACLFWELVWGMPGLFLAMPLMAAVKAVCSHVPAWKPWANLMSSHEDLPEQMLPPVTVAPSKDDRAGETHLLTGAGKQEVMSHE